jgi:hypothetical protein
MQLLETILRPHRTTLPRLLFAFFVRCSLWFLANSTGGVSKIIGFGLATSKPVIGDWDGNGTANIGIFDNGMWFLANDSGGIYKVIGFGSPTATPVAGRW